MESTSLCVQVDHLADLLRERVNSQMYTSIYERWRPKLYRTLKNYTVRRVLWDYKVPGTIAGTRVAAAPGPAGVGPAAEFLGESQVNSSLPCQIGRLEQHQDGPGCLMLLGRRKTKWQTHRGGIHLLRL